MKALGTSVRAAAVSWRRDESRVLPGVALLVGVGWLLAYALGTALLPPGGWETVQVDALRAVPPAAGVGAATVAARRLRRSGEVRSGRAWTWVAGSCALTLAGDGVFAAAHYVGGEAATISSWADLPWALALVVLIPAVLAVVPRAVLRRRVGTALDAVVAAFGLDSLLYVLVIGGHANPNSPRMIIPIVHPILDLVLLVVLLSRSGGFGQSRPLPIRLLATSFAVMLATDLTAALLPGDGSLRAGPWLSTGGQVAAVLIVLAAVATVRSTTDTPTGSARESGPSPLSQEDQIAAYAGVELPGQAEATGGAGSLIPILVGMLAVLAVVVVQTVTGEVARPTLVLSGVVVVAVIGRLLLSIADQRSVARALHVALGEQQRLAITDVLTGLYNRRFIEEMLVLETAKAGRDSGGLAVVLFDIDHFKVVNDTYGHQGGDSVLVEAASRIRSGVRASDVLGRWGGEEFLLVLRGTGEVDALAVAQRARRALSAEPIGLPDGRQVRVTSSAGVACLPRHGEDADSLLWQADQALYVAKGAGRDRVVLAGADPGSLQDDPCTSGPREP